MASNEDTKKGAPAKKAAVAKKAAPPKKAVPAKKAGKRSSAPDCPDSVEGVLDYDDQDRLCIRVGNVKHPIEDFAKLGKAELTLVVKLKKREAVQVSDNTAKLLEVLRQFLEKRAQIGIFGSVTTCRRDEP